MASDRYEAAKQLVHVALTGLPHGEEREMELRNAIRMLESVVEEERDAMREIAQAVATSQVVIATGGDADWYTCPFCHGDEDYKAPEHPLDSRFVHEPNCPVLKARALLAQQAG